MSTSSPSILVVFDTLRAIARRELVPVIQRYELGGSRSLPHDQPQTLLSTTDLETARRVLADARDPGATHALYVGRHLCGRGDEREYEYWAARWNCRAELPGRLYRSRGDRWASMAGMSCEYVLDQGLLFGPIPVRLACWLREQARNT